MSEIAAIVAIAFWVLLFSGGALIALSGDRSAQCFLGAILVATILTAATDTIIPKPLAAYVYLAIDSTLLAIAFYYVLTSVRYWPIWFAGFHSIAVAGQITRIIYAGPLPSINVDLAGFWSIPALIVFVIGVQRDRRSIPEFRYHIDN